MSVSTDCVVYREEGLALRQKSPQRRRSAIVRQPKGIAVAPNEIWSMDFMHDRLSDGRKFRPLWGRDLLLP
jgi:putative transposase